VAAGLVAVIVSIAGLALLVAVFRPGHDRTSTVNGTGGITLLVSSSGPSGDQALLTGTLTTEDGCVAVSSGPGSSVFVLWPAGYSLAEEAGTFWLVDDAGNPIAMIGDEIRMGGGSTTLADAKRSVPDGIPTACEVAGPDAYFLAGTPEVVPPATQSETSPEYFPLVFPVARDGWTVHNFDAVERGSATKAWAATLAIDDRDLVPRAPAIPVHTIESLPPGGAVIVALATPWHLDPNDGPWPVGSLDDLRLSDATIRGPEAEEPRGDLTIYDVANEYTSVRVFFRGAPTGAEVEAAQGQLETLEVPPTCPIGDETSIDRTEADPGEAVTLNGPMPFQREDGSYDEEGDTIAIAWWNADLEDWPYLSSFSTRSPSPAGPGPILKLGEGGRGQCSFTITFTAPDVPPGDYRIVVIQEGPLPNPDGSALMAGLVLHVR
jgi:hypothetical protein